MFYYNRTRCIKTLDIVVFCERKNNFKLHTTICDHVVYV